MKRLNSSGMSLVEVLVAVGIMGVIAMAMAYLIDSNLKQVKFLEAKLEANNVMTFAQINFNDSASCVSNFQNINIPAGSMTVGQEIILPKNQLRLANDLLENYKTSNFILNDAVFKVVTTANAGSAATGNLIFGFLPKPGTPPGIIPKNQSFPIYLEVSATGQVTNCPRPSPTAPVVGGIAPVNMSSYGSYTQSLPPGAFTTPPLIFISPKWSRFSGDEDTAWWVSNITTTGFTINWSGPGGGSNHGTNGVIWKAEAAP